jgi:hypothetical protein
MGQKSKSTKPVAAPPRRMGPRVERRAHDPAVNTRPRGNGERDRGETEKSTRKLAGVLGH